MSDSLEKAQAGARRARELRAGRDAGEPALFVLRMAHPSSRFAWEVRRYGGIVLACGEGYADEQLARAAGQRALIALQTNDATNRCPDRSHADPASDDHATVDRAGTSTR